MLKTSLTILMIAAAIPTVAAGREPVSRMVPYADLDLSTPAGLARFDTRIASAIEEACGSTVSVDLRGRADIRRCRAEARASAAPQRERVLAALSRSETRVAAR